MNSSPFCVFLVLVILTSISLLLSLQKNYFYKDMQRQSAEFDFFNADGNSLQYITLVQAEQYVLD